MVKILKLLAYAIFFVMALIYFLPKDNLYYYLEEELQTKKVIISDEQLVDAGFTLNINRPLIYFDAIEVAKVEEINIGLFLAYNSIEVRNIELSTMASSFIPVNVAYINAWYTLVNPTVLQAKAEGDFGVADIVVNIVERELHIKLVASKLMLSKYKSVLRSLKKNEEGEYIYVKNF